MKEEEINRRVTWAFVIEEGFKKNCNRRLA